VSAADGAPTATEAVGIVVGSAAACVTAVRDVASPADLPVVAVARAERRALDAVDAADGTLPADAALVREYLATVALIDSVEEFGDEAPVPPPSSDLSPGETARTPVARPALNAVAATLGLAVHESTFDGDEVATWAVDSPALADDPVARAFATAVEAPDRPLAETLYDAVDGHAVGDRPVDDADRESDPRAEH